MTAERILCVVLLLDGGILALALPCALLPTDWMAFIHQVLGLGDLPRGPIVEYLTRSLSLLYAVWSPLHIYLAFHIRRLAREIRLFSMWKLGFAIGMLALDLWAGMPWYWTIGEGPGIALMALAGIVLAGRIEQKQRPAEVA